MILLAARLGCFSASWAVSGGRWLSFATKCPETWHARMRSSNITGVLLASDSAKPCSTALVMLGRFGLGSRSHIWDFIANA